MPVQHGAWAMLVVPFFSGVILRASQSELRPHLIPLFAFWMLGYFTFNAASQWLKAAPKRRPNFVKPMLVYGSLSAAMGIATLALAGWQLLAWAPAFLPFLLPALWLAAQRNERATLGGALTIAAAALMTLVARYDSPAAMAADPHWFHNLVVASGVFVYFFGTVWYVKTNIRERGSPRFYAISLGWHGGNTLVAAVMAAVGLIGWWWTAFLAVTTVRAAWVPRIEPRVTPLKIGVLEITLSALLLLGIGLTSA